MSAKVTRTRSGSNRTSTDAGVDRLSRLESALVKVAEGVKQSAEQMETIQSAVKELAERVKQPPKMNIIPSHDNVMKDLKLRSGEMVSRRRTQDLLHPNAQLTGFQSNDIVELTENSPKYNTYRVNADGKPSTPADTETYPARGKVINYLYTKSHGADTGKRKYKVEFVGFGQDGILEDELVLLDRMV